MEEQKPRRKTHTSSAVKDRYNAKAYDDIKLRVKKGEKAFIQSEAEREGKSLNAYINDCISGKKTGMYLAGTSEEVTKMLQLLDQNKPIHYIYHITAGEIIDQATPAEIIKLIATNSNAYLQIVV